MRVKRWIGQREGKGSGKGAKDGRTEEGKFMSKGWKGRIEDQDEKRGTREKGSEQGEKSGGMMDGSLVGRSEGVKR